MGGGRGIPRVSASRRLLPSSFLTGHFLLFDGQVLLGLLLLFLKDILTDGAGLKLLEGECIGTLQFDQLFRVLADVGPFGRCIQLRDWLSLYLS